MRTPLLLAATAAMAVTAMPAAAQRVGHGVSRPAPVMHARPGPGRIVHQPGPRWGGKVHGRWHGGHYAPGGWGAYRRPVVGWVMPRYWVAPSFYVHDYRTYALPAPQAGYSWYRYYDDAVLADANGRVYDTRGGLDWDRYDDGRYVREDGYYDRYPERRDNGVGGAVIGGVVGGVAGNVIAGRGNRLGGTLIGAGVGAVAGAAIDRAEDRGRPAPGGYGAGDGYGAPYPLPGDDVPVAPDDGAYDDRAYDDGAYSAGPPPRVAYAPYAEQVQPLPGSRHDRAPVIRDRNVTCHGSCNVTLPYHGYAPGAHVATVQGGYVAGGYYYPPATVTTVTVHSAPVVTTRTVEEVVTYGTARRKVRRAAPKSKTLCRC